MKLVLSLWKFLQALVLLLILDAGLNEALARGEPIPWVAVPFVLLGMGALWLAAHLVNAARDAADVRRRDELDKAVAELKVRMAAKEAENQRRQFGLSAWEPEKAADMLPAHAAKPEDADVTVFAPPEVRPNDNICVQVVLHTPSQAEQAHVLATEVDPESQKLASRPLTVPLSHGDKIRVTLDPGEAEMVERVQTIEWLGKVAQCLFFMKIPQISSSQSRVTSKVFIFVNGIPAGYVTFKLLITPEASAQLPLPVNETVHKYRRAFMSYASQDRLHVLRAAQLLAAMKIDFFQDVLSLTPGQRWENRLYAEIDEADLFMLFWSRHAAQSEWVVKEAEYALNKVEGQGGNGRLQFHPIILEGPPAVTPPPSLAAVHFNDPVRYVIFAEEMMAAKEPAPRTAVLAETAETPAAGAPMIVAAPTDRPNEGTDITKLAGERFQSSKFLYGKK